MLKMFGILLLALCAWQSRTVWQTRQTAGGTVAMGIGYSVFLAAILAVMGMMILIGWFD